MRLIGSTVLFSVLLQALSAPTEDWQTATSIYDFSATDIDGNEVSLDRYRSNSLPSLTTLSLTCSVRST
uniref:Glutathione peroxidase 4a n=1 Tax=Seriola dumerili TaxID=41447 RepID=A0A3B4TEU6_SERDU